MARVIALVALLVGYVAAQCSLQVTQTVANSWTSASGLNVQYDVVVVNKGPDAVNSIKIQPYGGAVSQYWSASSYGDGSYGFASWITAFPSGSSWSWGFIMGGVGALSVTTSPACSVNVFEVGTVPSSSGSSASGNTGSGSGSSGSSGSSSGSNTPTSYCTGNPPTYNGLPCATTTRYFDTTTGACGCGVGNGGYSPFPWQASQYTAAGSQALFGPEMSTWCGSGCGSCFEIAPTGDCPTGGSCASSTQPIVVMITNLCPYNGNQEWCPNPGSTNQHGYAAHFDLLNTGGWVDKLGWNNPAVTYRQVPCGSLGSPTCSEAAECQCQTSPCTQGGSVSNIRIAESSRVNVTSPLAGDMVQKHKAKPLSNSGVVGVAIAGGLIGLIAIVVVIGKMVVMKKKQTFAPERTEPLLANEVGN